MIFKINTRKHGEHMHVTVFAAPKLEQTFACLGTLKMRTDEWVAFDNTLRFGSERLAPYPPSTSFYEVRFIPRGDEEHVRSPVAESNERDFDPPCRPFDKWVSIWIERPIE